MTENKRYKCHVGVVGVHIGVGTDEHELTGDECRDLLNKLVKENEQLKQEIRNLQDFRGFITEKNVENEQQRKELQLQMLRLYNYFEDYFEDGMGSTAFSEMWDNVKESEKWNKKKGMRK